MRKSDVEARKRQLRKVELQSRAEIKTAQRIMDFTATRVFADAANGVNSFLTPTADRKSYIERVKHYSDADPLIPSLKREAERLPQADYQKWYNRINLRIAIIADEFLFDAVKVAADFIYLSPSNFESSLAEADMLLVASTWRGLDGEWDGFANPASSVREFYRDEVRPYASKLGIPVVFYSKEDPPHFNQFKDIAATADSVFTSAVEKVSQYEELVRNDVPVSSIPFAINYQIHNPLGCERHRGREATFAGSWWAEKFSQRSDGARNIFDGIEDSRSELRIFDRNLYLDETEFSNLEKYNFPDAYLHAVREPISHSELMMLQRLLPLAINLNSVIGSQTMFANRVVELLAMGSVVMSNYNSGINSNHPYVATLSTPRDTQQFIDNLDDDYLRYCRVEGIRDVFRENSAFKLIGDMANSVGLKASAPRHRILIATETREDFQSFVNGQDIDWDLEWVDVSKLDGLVGGPDGDLLIFGDNFDRVSPDIVSDIVAAFSYSSADCLHVLGFDEDIVAYEPVDSYKLPQIDAVWLDEGEGLHNDALKSGLMIRSSFSAAGERGSRSRESDDWAPELSVVVPVYNNGRHLLHKCFQSLVRSPVFSKAEVILVDDGSTDLKTGYILEMLNERFSNVKLYRFGPGGSGSASRPRNKGLELASAPYVTYLDPDNEQTDDGFSLLLNKIRATNSDFVIGDMLKLQGGRQLIKNCDWLKASFEQAGYQCDINGRYLLGGQNSEVLKASRFQPMSIQALVANTAWLRETGLTQPVGAVGQDSYFFQQLLYYARSVTLLPSPIHIYYAEVANSTVNSVSPKFYRAYLPLETARAGWLRDIGLLADYVELRFFKFLEVWYLQKLKRVASRDRQDSLHIIHQLAQLYGDPVLKHPEYARLMNQVGFNQTSTPSARP